MTDMTNAQPPVVSQRAAKLKPQYPDYLDDPDGLNRFRRAAQYNRGHDMAAVNHNSLGRLVDTIDRLVRERDAAILALSTSKAATSDEVVPEVCVPVERLRKWYTGAWVTWLETISDGDEEDGGPTPKHLLEMEAMLAATPTPPALDDEATRIADRLDALSSSYRPLLTAAANLLRSRPTGAGESVEAMRERCAKVCDDAADRLDDGRSATGKRINQVDLHTIDVLRRRAREIRALPLTTDQGGQS